MILFKSANTIESYLGKKAAEAMSTGFIPTMGALHPGHISLVEQSKKENDLTVCSIFINPTQFNNPVDLEKYPVSIEKDIDMLERSGCDVLFLPSVDEIYPPGSALQHYDLGYLETVLEGQYRPGHFQGVCQVVDRLLGIINPGKLYLGQKDYQQCMVVKKLLELKNIRTSLVICPTLRENTGLAMSSRNLRLTAAEKLQAVLIHDCLVMLKSELEIGSLQALKSKARDRLTAKGFKVDYVEIADASNLTIENEWDGQLKLVALIAAYLGDTRLIDNLVLN